ncbi:hypothetical protein KVR01_005033 [Diaporthe batatas]|uniref:uncharacterized protein n=1 Tax=Diaporthe batatas TaxID=748121 RepID=UPI001D05B678|nr:uncharacterized protein KVR01_005033 [Diaporthe batatas]KAG8164758.1 hypothetical protein KVR01_005033 [Diaporthe batatas]
MRHFGTKAAGSLGRPSSVDEADRTTSASPPPDVDRSQDAGGVKAVAEEEEEEEDDYMNMTFDDPPAKQPETSLQRSQRLRKEGLKRGIIPSKAELAAQERQRREEGLSRSLITGAAGGAGPDDTGTPPPAANPKTKSKGLAMMAKMGFTPGSALGSRDNPSARSEPLRIETKEDRGGIGADADKKRKLAEAAEAAGVAKRARLEEIGDYRVRMARERDAARKEKLVFAAQKIAEKMDEDGEGAPPAPAAGAGAGEVRGGAKKAVTSRPLKSVPVVYRGLVRRREEAERDRRMRYDLEQSSGGLSAKLPAYEDDGMDDDDKMALGVGTGGPPAGRTETNNKTVFMPADDLDQEDQELDEFEALEVGDKLAGLVAYLRERHRYCFWCKLAYPDEEMEGCPGLTEEDHD